MKYRPGDKVKIRNDLAEYKRYGSYTFLPYMNKFKGEQIIKELTHNGYTIKADTQGFKWSDEMFEDIKEDKMDNQNITVNMENLSDEERNTLLELINKANKPKSKVWKPEDAELYYFIRNDGQICYTHWNEIDLDQDRYGLGNCFKTEDEAKFALEKLKVITELKRFAIEHNEGEINWNDNKQYKYILCFDHDENCVKWVQYQHAHIYFTSREIAEQAIKKIGKERLKKYYFEVND